MHKCKYPFHYVISSLLFLGISFIPCPSLYTCLLVILSFVSQSACKLLRDRNRSLFWIWAVPHSKGSRSRTGNTSCMVQSHQIFKYSHLTDFLKHLRGKGNKFGWGNLGRIDPALLYVEVPISEIDNKASITVSCRLWVQLGFDSSDHMVVSFFELCELLPGSYWPFYLDYLYLFTSDYRGNLNRLIICRHRSMQTPITVGPHTELSKCHTLCLCSYLPANAGSSHSLTVNLPE